MLFAIFVNADDHSILNAKYAVLQAGIEGAAAKHQAPTSEIRMLAKLAHGVTAETRGYVEAGCVVSRSSLQRSVAASQAPMQRVGHLRR